ncbi:YdbH domain-containing protein [Marinobacter orientalis]|uniref:YdbH domain-containing protein n=1 Tax=Marinobacter orientalis TaxID=1928859 RepID=A0A7Y0RDJ4_9GAMM|nr:YdbH domain-containing protein [Marinobacter orientalis]NMT64276.1 YdbH domain-containing protein [Marinobacter orientalis]TGX49494.1 hypothetical protein DIT72_11790 [Marinobacter orientalis]
MTRSVTRFRTFGRLLLGLLVLLLLLLIAGGWYARVAWEEWRQAHGIRNPEWQGVDVSLAAVRLQDFSVSQMRDGEVYRAEGRELSLGWSWHWHGPMLDVVRVGQLTVEIPEWPANEGQDGPSAGMPADLPLWLPETVTIDQLVLMLPDGIRARGDLAVSQLSVPDERELVTNGMNVELPVAPVTLADWQLRAGQANLMFAGKASEQSASLEFNDGTRIELARVDAPDNAAQLDNVRVNLAGTRLNARYHLQSMALEELTFEGPVDATTATIRHPQLLLQPWRLAGRLEVSLEAFSLDGRLTSDAGAGADIAFSLPFAGVPDLDAEMTASGAKASRALSKTFTAWPAGLEIDEGSVGATLGASLPSRGVQMQGEIVFDGAGGLFARTAWTGLEGKLAIDLSGERLEIDMPGLVLDTVNPGIALKNIEVSGGYRSATAQLGTGTLTLEHASAQLLGGRVYIEPTQWQLSELPLRVPLELNGIELSELMQVYPAQGLAGSGVLEGTMPVWISEEGVSVESGRIEALAPGGTLKLPADRLRAMAQDNEVMALVVQAMQNFNYSVLNSTVDYDRDGKLVLGLRLEGSSPDVRDGHPIVLNINLEEDIPALLTSLQLSGRVNEAVTEKVRKLMQEREAQSESAGSGN